MLGTIATVTIVAIEVGLVAYNMSKQGVFDNIKNKFKSQVSNTRDFIKQEELKCLPQS